MFLFVCFFKVFGFVLGECLKESVLVNLIHSLDLAILKITKPVSRLFICYIKIPFQKMTVY